MRRTLGLATCLIVLLGQGTTPAAEPKSEGEGWVSLFDGQSLDGWKANENAESWSVRDGAIVAHGKPKSHLFYVGPEVKNRPFANFEFKAEVQTRPGSNGGVYIHTQYQDSGWPKYGFEIQVNNTHRDPVKTGSLYHVVNVTTAPANDNDWFELRIVIKGKRVETYVNGAKLVNYTEPEGKQPGKDFTRVLDQGTFALQAHDPKSEVLFRNLRVRRLP